MLISVLPAWRRRSAVAVASAVPSSGAAAVEHRDDRREPAVQVDAVVAVADRLVERRQRRGLLVDPVRGGAQPGDDAVMHRLDAPAQGRRVDRRVPQPVSSSSSRRSVTEKPAISRLVM